MKFNPKGYNDVAWAGIFLGHVALVLAWIGYSAASGKYQVQQSVDAAVALYHGKAVFSLDTEGVNGVFSLLIFASIAFALVWSVLWLLALHRCPEEIVRVSLIFSPCLLLVMGLVSLMQGNIIGAGFAVFSAALFAAYAWSVWHRVALTAGLFKSLSHMYQKASGVFGVALAAIFVQVIWMVVCAMAFIPVKRSGYGMGAYFLLAVSFYWGFQVIANVLYVTCGGVAARHYFNEQVDGAVASSAKQASTNYLGSICFGSLMIAIVQALRLMCEMAKEQAKEDDNLVAVIVLMVADCFLACLESVVRFFNSYVFSYIAISGYDFSEASNKVWSLLFESDADLLLNYSLVGAVSVFGGFAAGLFDAILTSLCAWRMGLEGSMIFGAAFVGFLVGFGVMSVVSYVMEAGCTTLFVCFAESKDLLFAFDKELGSIVDVNLNAAKEKKKLIS